VLKYGVSWVNVVVSLSVTALINVMKTVFVVDI